MYSLGDLDGRVSKFFTGRRNVHEEFDDVIANQKEKSLGSDPQLLCHCLGQKHLLSQLDL